MTNLNFNDMPIDYSITSTNDKDKKVGVTLKSFIIDELKDIVVDFENINDVYTNDENMVILFARNFYHFKGAGGDGSKHR
jgi:hypothetical protein